MIDLDRIERTVTDVEARTAAEVLVAINRRSGTYHDLELLFGVAWGVLAAGFMIASPWKFTPRGLLPNAFLVALVAYAAARLSPGLVRRLASRGRRERQAMVHARNAFCVLGAGATRDRVGLLVYVSLLEDRVVLLPDHGLEGRIEAARWQAVLDRFGVPSRHRDLSEALCGLLTECGTLLAERVPAAGENPNEVPNRPRLEVL